AAEPPPDPGHLRPERAAAGRHRGRRSRLRPGGQPGTDGRRAVRGRAPGSAAPRSSTSFPIWLAAAGVLALGYLFRGLVVPFLLAMGMAYLLNPLIAWVEGFGIRRATAVTALYVGLAILVVGAAAALGPRLHIEATGLADRLPALADEVDAALVLAARDLVLTIPAARRFLPSSEARRGWIEQILEGRGGRLADFLENAGHPLLPAVLVPVFAFFLLRDSRRLLTLLLNRVPPAHIETTVAMWGEVNRIIGGYIRGVALDGLVMAVLASFGLWILRVPYPLLLGAFAGLANLVPVVGPLMAARPVGPVGPTPRGGARPHPAGGG